MRKKTFSPQLILFFVLPILFTTKAEAGYGKGNHVVSVSFGGVLGVNDLDQVKGTGPGGGLAYRYYTSDLFSFGLDMALDDYGNHYSRENETDVDTTLFSTSLMGRIDFYPRNEWASYFSFGFGSQYAQMTFHEVQGDRKENTSQGGYFFALGFEGPFKGNWMWGGELRSTDPLGVSADAIGLKLSLSRRFGKDVTKSKESFD